MFRSAEALSRSELAEVEREVMKVLTDSLLPTAVRQEEELLLIINL
jgi:hypothetical protein